MSESSSRRRRPNRIGAGLLVGWLGLLIGCQNNDRLLTPRTEVRGKVYLDGKPLESGLIEFETVGESAGMNSGQSETPAVTAFAVVRQGAYQIEATEGPAVGVNRIRVRPAPLPREQLEAMLDVKSISRHRGQPLVVQEIHPGYGDNSPLRAELKADQINFHDVRLKSGGP